MNGLPVDEGLPGLATLAGAGAARRVRLLAHRKGRRATVALTGDGPPRIVKLFSRDEFATALAVTQASLRHDGLAPALVEVDEDLCLLELEHVGGEDLHATHPARLGRALHGLGPVLARVHAADPAGLPPWDTGWAADRLVSWLHAAAAVDPGVAARARAAVDVLLPRITAVPAAPVCLHGDVSLRNVMVGPAGLRLIDWDRGAYGAAEVDLAILVGALGTTADRVVAGYRAAGGRVDEALLDDLVLASRVTRALRRFARGREAAATAVARFDLVDARLRRSGAGSGAGSVAGSVAGSDQGRVEQAPEIDA